MKDYFIEGLISAVNPINLLFYLVIAFIVSKATIEKKASGIFITLLAGISFIIYNLLINLQLNQKNWDFLFYTEIFLNVLLIIILPLYIILNNRFKKLPIFLYILITLIAVCKTAFIIANRFSSKIEVEDYENIKVLVNPISVMVYTLGSALLLPIYTYFISINLQRKQNKKWHRILYIVILLLIVIYSIISTTYFLMVLKTQNVA
jgi:hypothetical protein